MAGIFVPAGEEMFDVVDEDDNVIGKAPRSVIHAEGLIHRSVVWFEFETDPFGRIYVTQRSMNKEFHKGEWSIVLGGHPFSGESYDAAVTREHEEEAHLRGEPVHIASFKKRLDRLDRENVRVYGFMEDGREPQLDREEFIGGGYVDGVQMARKLCSERFLPETRILLGILRDYRHALRH